MRGTILAALAVTVFVAMRVLTPMGPSAPGWAAIVIAVASGVYADVLRRRRVGPVRVAERVRR